MPRHSSWCGLGALQGACRPGCVNSPVRKRRAGSSVSIRLCAVEHCGLARRSSTALPAMVLLWPRGRPANPFSAHFRGRSPPCPGPNASFTFVPVVSRSRDAFGAVCHCNPELLSRDLVSPKTLEMF